MELPWPGTEPSPCAVEAGNLNHWTSREAKSLVVFIKEKSGFKSILQMAKALKTSCSPFYFLFHGTSSFLFISSLLPFWHRLGLNQAGKASGLPGVDLWQTLGIFCLLAWETTYWPHPWDYEVKWWTEWEEKNRNPFQSLQNRQKRFTT